jgi:hypothetical protein
MGHVAMRMAAVAEPNAAAEMVQSLRGIVATLAYFGVAGPHYDAIVRALQARGAGRYEEAAEILAHGGDAPALATGAGTSATRWARAESFRSAALPIGRSSLSAS